MGRLELTVLLDVIADRLLEPTRARLVHGEDDRLAAATHADPAPRPGRHRGAGAVGGPAGRARPRPTPEGDDDPFLVTGNVQSYLRALHLQLALAPRPPACRADLLLVLIDAAAHGEPALPAR